MGLGDVQADAHNAEFNMRRRGAEGEVAGERRGAAIQRMPVWVGRQGGMARNRGGGVGLAAGRSQVP